MNKKTLVTRSYLPPMDEYITHLEKLWESHWLTNDGELLKELEEKLKAYLGVKHVFFVANGTIAMQLALKALGVSREVITTPFSFPATPNVILWEGCSPVFADISAKDMCIDPQKIEAAITPRTEAILAVHVYGNPCQVEKIAAIAKKHKLKVIYDAAHTFGVTYKGKSLVSYGDVSTLSFHATKLFHTGEGGAIVTNDDAVAEKINQYRNFGWSEKENNFIEIGINAKNSEFHAAMGLSVLGHIGEIIKERKKLSQMYQQELIGTTLTYPERKKGTDYNFAYYPVVFRTEKELLSVKDALEKENIFPRRYFYPSLNTLPYVSSVICPVSESYAQRVLCLPLYNGLKPQVIKTISRIIKRTLSVNDRKPTVTIGIPAHNEAGNIRQLIQSITSQHQTNFQLKKIIVTLDGCTDQTEKILRKLQKHYPIITIRNDGRRLGKVGRLNQLYQENTSDLLLTLDGDVLLNGHDQIHRMVRRFEDIRIQVVSAHQEPVKPKRFIPQLIYSNYLLWNEIRKCLPTEKHVANLYGSATMLRKQFAKTVTYPQWITADYDFLYLKAAAIDGFAYEKNTQVLYATPATITEFRRTGTRFLQERGDLVSLFGPQVLTMHAIPTSVKLRGTLRMLLRSPFLTIFGILLLFSFRVMPEKDSSHKDGIWQIATTTKRVLPGV